MAHIQKINNGKKYKAIVEVGTTGNRKRRTKTFERKKDAQSWIASMINDQDQGTYVDPSHITVAQFMERFLKNHKKPKVATTTYDGYLNRYKGYIKPKIGHIPLQELDAFYLEEFFANLRNNGKIRGQGGLSENTLKKVYVLLNQGLKRAIKMQLIKQNPLEAIETPKPKNKEVKALPQKKLNKLLKTAKEEDYFTYVFIYFASFTGMRLSEILGLEWTEIDLKEGIISVKKRLIKKSGEGVVHEKDTKNKSSNRKIKIHENLISILKEYKKWQLENRMAIGPEYNENKEFVFCRPDGKNYYPTTINDKVKKMMKKANLSNDYSTHTLRHTFATLSLKKEIPPKIVSEMLGHADISTTLDIYSHVDINMQEKAVNKLNEAINTD